MKHPETFRYDGNGNLTATTDRKGQTLSFRYDSVNRLIEKVLPALIEGPGNLVTSFGYDSVDNLSQVSDPDSRLSFTYDLANRLTSAATTGSPNQPEAVIDYTYDKNDNRLTMAETLSGAQPAATNYVYDPLNRRTEREYVTPAPQRSLYSYDMANQLTELVNEVTGGLISGYAYTYDQVGNRLSMETLEEVHRYSYNPIYELEGVTEAPVMDPEAAVPAHSYDYDNVGSRVTADGTTYIPNALNQYDQVGATALDYDANGNLTDDGASTYTYDAQNRLAAMDSAAGSASYAYDGLNRRVSKIVDGGITYYVYDGDEEVEEWGWGGISLVAEYVYGPIIDEVLVMERDGDRSGTFDAWELFLYHEDGLGSVSELTDAEGTVAESYRYVPYGQVAVSGTPTGNPYLFTGRRFDEESGLYHYRARAYHPSLGRFLERDPMGYEDSLNLYSYVLNNPGNLVDPYGEQYMPSWWVPSPTLPGPMMPGVPPGTPNVPLPELPQDNLPAPDDPLKQNQEDQDKNKKQEDQYCAPPDDGGDDDPRDPWWKKLWKRWKKEFRERIREKNGSTGMINHPQVRIMIRKRKNMNQNTGIIRIITGLQSIKNGFPVNGNMVGLENLQDNQIYNGSK